VVHRKLKAIRAQLGREKLLSLAWRLSIATPNEPDAVLQYVYTELEGAFAFLPHPNHL